MIQKDLAQFKWKLIGLKSNNILYLLIDLTARPAEFSFRACSKIAKGVIMRATPYYWGLTWCSNGAMSNLSMQSGGFEA